MSKTNTKNRPKNEVGTTKGIHKVTTVGTYVNNELIQNLQYGRFKFSHNTSSIYFSHIVSTKIPALKKSALIIHDKIKSEKKSFGTKRRIKIHQDPIIFNFIVSKKNNEGKKDYILVSPFGDTTYNILFEKNNYISNENNLWKILYIINDENIFKETLIEFKNVINSTFIENLFKKADFTFYLDIMSKKVYVNESSQAYQKISLFEILQYLNINQIENLIEKNVVIYG